MDAWEGLLVEEEVLESFLKKCDATTSLIPCPAGNVQAALMNRISDDQHTTQQFAEEVAQATYDRDFNSNPWMWAEMFVKHHELVLEGDMKKLNQLDSAKSIARLPLVACLVKECKPNGLGDMQLTIKDPSGTMKASLNRKVLQDPQIGPHIGVGCVLLLNLVTHLTQSIILYT
ncbi:uncharacterized protein LOC108344279 [Vigna angularis]|uniref:uncharacterized protein LOC108344279 n=1 Tax=Phaseolus angularis TaxID=3914 RepID=UPI0022B55FB0|nr:uncharacterized protein LOC108344279 [Vigna angularis]